MTFVVLVGIWVACGLIGAGFGARRGKSNQGSWIGFLFGPVGLAFLVAVDYAQPAEDKDEDKGETSSGRDSDQCGSCGTAIPVGVTICRHCQHWQDAKPRRSVGRRMP